MAFVMNPFKKHDVSEFPGVWIPLSDQHRHHSVTAETEINLKDTSEVEKKATSNSDHESDPVAPLDYSPLTIEALRAEIDEDVAASGHDTAYDRKSKVINRAIQDIGMGSYQWQLFVLCGFGWLADNLWLQGVALTLPALTQEFGPSSTKVRYTTCALFVGLCLGASIWGVLSDVIGRRLAFNCTLFLAGVFGLAAGGGPNWVGTCGLFSALGVGVGGNLPVDGALFLEFLPFESGGLLTMLSVWWPVGQLIASLIAWGFIPNYSCATDLKSCNVTAPGEACCHKSDNMGWRYFVITLGALTFAMFVCRFFFFHLFESPKFLLSQGRQPEAVAVVHGIAYKNGRKTWLTEEILNEIGGHPEEKDDAKLSTKEIVLRFFEKFSAERVGPLFHNKRLGFTTAIIWFCWCTIGMGYPLFNAFLPQYLESSKKGQAPTSTYTAYRNYVITSVVGVPGSIIAAYTVNIKYIGRKGTMAISTIITGVLVYLFTISSAPNYQVGFSSVEAFFQNIITPEVFPAPNRGTGTGIGSFLNRIAGLCAPIIAVNASSNPSAPIYASGGLFLAAGFAMLLLPIETRGKQSL
ncbi:MAG: hypothetical protein M1819_002379 [Sarea resinae]|nr:MAG: hypothetical protein M1819_002379 [Sarea resinae]